MKSTFYRSALFLSAGALLIASCKRHPAESEVVVFGTNVVIPDYQSKPLKAYQLSEENAINEVTALNNVNQLLMAMGEQLNFDLTNKMKEGDRLFFMNKQDPSASCMVNLKSGDISANGGTKNYMNYGATPDLLKKEEAMRAAKQYIQQLRYADLNDVQMVPGHIGGVNMGSHDEQNKSQIFEKFTTVRFNRQFDGIPVLGHSRIIVQLAEKGRLHGMIRQWAAYNGSPVSREAEALPDDIKKSIAQHLTKENEASKRITVKQINLVYYESREMIEPALHVICEVELPRSKTDSTRVTYPYDIVEPILKNPRMVYTYMAESHRDQPKQNDEVNTKEPPKRGEDEQKQ
jgi:hypothetical protein